MKNLIILFLLASATVAAADPTLYKVVPGKQNTTVQFESDAPLETVIGRTNTATGYVELNGSSGRSEIHVDLASLKTGIPLRDRDMRENHLETSKYPEAVFTTTSLELPANGLVQGVRMRVNVRGNLSLHGVTHEITPESYLTLAPGGQFLRIESAFQVRLDDYNITRQLLRLRLAKEQEITVDITAVNESRGETTQKGDK